jgi:hypothetical protein
MPSRLWCLAILALWVATLGWFVRREILPHYLADAPPLHQIDLSDEAMRQSIPVRWSLSRNGQYLAPVNTLVKFNDADDTFSVISDVFRFELVKVGDTALFVEKFRNVYRVTRRGTIVGMQTQVIIKIGGESMEVNIAADIVDGQAVPRCQVKSPWINLEPKLEPIAVAAGGGLNPMHPVHRINGLRVGQRWAMPLIDSLADVQRAAIEGVVKKMSGLSLPSLGETGRQVLIAEVTGPMALEWNGIDHECLVIEYRGDNVSGKTWVRRSDGLVLRQEARNGTDELVLQRE